MRQNGGSCGSTVVGGDDLLAAPRADVTQGYHRARPLAGQQSHAGVFCVALEGTMREWSSSAKTREEKLKMGNDHPSEAATEEGEESESEEGPDEVDLGRRSATSALTKLDKSLLDILEDLNKTEGKERLGSQRPYAESVLKQMRLTKKKLDGLGDVG